ncbi:uncharacterized protein LOC126904678 [Daktulosphaira vitifoliae]|uniref:uncharacterized protein LOC126904678 n=1 Tax=Daktulosphaira vitifoliae TaxID=58002 RepID=UPI0021AA4EAD|nr:uncharacterized protein LOC126904678 [Daktulosphaira vitifoliae]XP_050539853.1 uncharacterized protein LOC126904678 [Daktulosphaira vitifoliae]XP_050539854.1 uncharacterized protein LOC126904678 [Daktulosphaira vitifoliae]XP_050539855.1 uncharacterized protein LOC126904678 [Daktulosphaira vitifoliae]XP_050539857.1 uncharacterized protein LOC126904678 [Daktulosphaira vitifoliae]XP_050539858.1 uncharacterized protein LOC126904678 [Daktulosphaira vitifoliae]XP_050539859.1 uncharacterized prot
MKVYISQFIKPRRWPVTLEPMLFLFFLSYMISMIVNSNMVYWKGCNLNVTEEPDIGIIKCEGEDKDKSLKEMALINIWKLIAQEIIGLSFIVFAGPWSDNHGCRRLPLLFLPVIGQITGDLLNIFSAVYWNEVTPAVTSIGFTLVTTITGSMSCFFIGMYSYLSDITDNTNRTMRLGFASAVVPLAATIGPILSGILNVKIGFINVFLFNILLNISGLCFGILLIYDSSDPNKVIKSTLKSTFDPKIVKNIITIVLKERKNHKRTILHLMMIASAIIMAPFLGEMSVMPSYLRKTFNFTEISFSQFYSYLMGVMLIGTTISLGIFSRIFRMNDSLIGLIATVFDLAAAVAFFLVRDAWLIMFVPLLQLFRGASLAIHGAIASKCVEPYEIASMNSFRLVIEGLFKALVLPMYNMIYYETLNTYPSAFFLLTVVLTIPCLFIFSITYYLTRTESEENSTEKNTTIKT